MKPIGYKDDIFNPNSSNNKEGNFMKAWKWCKSHKYTIFHITVLAVLTTYVILNWRLCVSMQFFSQFNGNNILFLVWIVLILLTLYDVEAKDIKVKERKIKEDYENAERLYTLNTMSQNINHMSKNNMNGDVKHGSKHESKHGSSNKNVDC